NPREEAKMEKKELQQILEGNDDAMKTMERVFKEHESVETVIVEPNSWAGKELLSQTKRLIDLRHDLYHEINHISASINHLSKKSRFFIRCLQCQEVRQHP
ncbi:hypothetical protein ABNF65_19745, partial [Paenibacillus larvae]